MVDTQGEEDLKGLSAKSSTQEDQKMHSNRAGEESRACYAAMPWCVNIPTVKMTPLFLNSGGRWPIQKQHIHFFLAQVLPTSTKRSQGLYL